MATFHAAGNAPRWRAGFAKGVPPPELLQSPRYELIPMAGALDQVRALPAGATVTVTSSPSRGIEPTVDLAQALATRGFQAIPHLAARSLESHDQLADVSARLHVVGVTDVFVVGGDATSAAGPFPDGLALLSALTRIGAGFARVGVPSYPEGHYAIDDETLWRDLAAKQALATYTVTQLCFDAGKICRFVAEARKRGISLPVTAGVAGAVDAARLLRVSLKVGVGESRRFVRGHNAVTRRLLRPHGYTPDALVRKLAARGRDGGCAIDGLHIYTFNQVQSTVDWLAEARLGERGKTRPTRLVSPHRCTDTPRGRNQR